MNLFAKWIFFSFVVIAAFLGAFQSAGFTWRQIVCIMVFVVGSFFMFWSLFLANWNDVFMKKEDENDQEEG